MTDPSQLLSDAGALVYLVVAVFIVVDAVFPAAPSETMLTAGGVLVASGELAAVALVVAGAAGAITGHTILYLAGRASGPAVLRRLTRQAKGAARTASAAEKLRSRPWLIIVADFVPWGRTVLMYSAGVIDLPWRQFLRCASIGAAIWSTFYVILGWATGSMFDSGWQALAISLVAAVSITLVLEAIGRFRGARHRADRLTGTAS